MNKQRCQEALVEMAAVCPRNVSGAVQRLGWIIDGTGRDSASDMTSAIRSLREAGVGWPEQLIECRSGCRSCSGRSRA